MWFVPRAARLCASARAPLRAWVARAFFASAETRIEFAEGRRRRPAKAKASKRARARGGAPFRRAGGAWRHPPEGRFARGPIRRKGHFGKRHGRKARKSDARKRAKAASGSARAQAQAGTHHADTSVWGGGWGGVGWGGGDALAGAPQAARPRCALPRHHRGAKAHPTPPTHSHPGRALRGLGGGRACPDCASATPTPPPRSPPRSARPSRRWRRARAGRRARWRTPRRRRTRPAGWSSCGCSGARGRSGTSTWRTSCATNTSRCAPSGERASERARGKRRDREPPALASPGRRCAQSVRRPVGRPPDVASVSAVALGTRVVGASALRSAPLPNWRALLR